jgi:hypothetical protein
VKEGVAMNKNVYEAAAGENKRCDVIIVKDAIGEEIMAESRDREQASPDLDLDFLRELFLPRASGKDPFR